MFLPRNFVKHQHTPYSWNGRRALLFSKRLPVDVSAPGVDVLGDEVLDEALHTTAGFLLDQGFRHLAVNPRGQLREDVVAEPAIGLVLSLEGEVLAKLIRERVERLERTEVTGEFVVELWENALSYRSDRDGVIDLGPGETRDFMSSE